SHTYIQFLAFLKIGFKISYRTVQGIVRGLSDYLKIEEIHFTQIRRRIVKIKPSVGNLNLDNDDNKPILDSLECLDSQAHQPERSILSA
ncbi:MAG TPA: hypothetical protein VEH06_17285, partial [Candidatus Bathyarchaeia archaeon]|nr:hypothetical protein [Candidatus Bathyarchaeia archaeon]